MCFTYIQISHTRSISDDSNAVQTSQESQHSQRQLDRGASTGSGSASKVKNGASSSSAGQRETRDPRLYKTKKNKAGNNGHKSFSTSSGNTPKASSSKRVDTTKASSDKRARIDTKASSGKAGTSHSGTSHSGGKSGSSTSAVTRPKSSSSSKKRKNDDRDGKRNVMISCISTLLKICS